MIPDLGRQRRVNFIVWIVAFALCVFCIGASIGKAEARTHRHTYQQQTWAWPHQSYYQEHTYRQRYRGNRHREYRPNRVRDRVHIIAHKRHSHKRKRHVADANGNRARSSLATIQSKKTGATARVGAKFADQFQAYIDDLESNHGATIHFMGGVRRGRCSPGSQHPCGKALDVCQLSWGKVDKRCNLPGRVALAAIAMKAGLFEGGTWCSNDYGHAQVSFSAGTCGRTLLASIQKFKRVFIAEAEADNEAKAYDIARPTLTLADNELDHVVAAKSKPHKRYASRRHHHRHHRHRYRVARR